MDDKNQDLRPPGPPVERGEATGEITLRCRVDAYRAGWTLLAFLTHRFRYHPEARWRQRIDERRVVVNGEAVPADHPVALDDEVAYTIRHVEPPVDRAYEVVYEDHDLMAVSKSGNLPVHAGGVFIRHTLIAILRERYGERLVLAHRLDRETSGLVVLAKHREAARALSRCFAAGEVEKSYIALVHGGVERNAFDVDAPIGRFMVPVAAPADEIPPDSDLAQDAPRCIPRRRVDPAGGKPAKTHFRVVRRFEREGRVFSIVDALPVTGRTNQIRVHLAHVGHPIVGDKAYGDHVADQEIALSRHALHCGALVFPHPVTGQPVRLTAPVPDDLQPWLE